MIKDLPDNRRQDKNEFMILLTVQSNTVCAERAVRNMPFVNEEMEPVFKGKPFEQSLWWY